MLGYEHCQPRAWTQNSPWKGNFPPRQGSIPESQAVFHQPDSPGRPEEGPAHILGWRNWREPETDLIKPTCLTQEGAEAKGGVVVFQGDSVSQWQSCEKNPGSPSLSEEITLTDQR